MKDTKLLNWIKAISDFYEMKDLSKSEVDKFMETMFKLQLAVDHLFSFELYDILSDLMFVLENYYSDETLREKNDPNENDVLVACGIALEKISSLSNFDLISKVSDVELKPQGTNSHFTYYTLHIKKLLRKNIDKENIYFFIRDMIYFQPQMKINLSKKFYKIFETYINFLKQYEPDETMRKANTPDENKIIDVSKETLTLLETWTKNSKL